MASTAPQASNDAVIQIDDDEKSRHTHLSPLLGQSEPSPRAFGLTLLLRVLIVLGSVYLCYIAYRVADDPANAPFAKLRTLLPILDGTLKMLGSILHWIGSNIFAIWIATLSLLALPVIYWWIFLVRAGILTYREDREEMKRSNDRLTRM